MTIRRLIYAFLPPPPKRRGRPPGQPSIHAERNAVIVSRINNGETLQAVASDYDMSRQRIEQIVKKAGITLGYRRNPRVNALVTAYERGEPLDRIAARLGYTYGAARQVLKHRGVEPPPPRTTRKYLTTPHGTYYAWNRYKCRCDLCHAAYTAYQQQQKADRYSRVGTLPPEKHGNYSTYLNWGCRCQPCRKAFQIHNRPYSAAWGRRNREKINAQRREARHQAKHAIDNAESPRVE